MKRIALLLFAVIMSTVMMAQRKETTILEVSGNLATPLTVHTSKGTYTVHSSMELNGSVSVRSAEDANGNKVVVPNGDYKSHTSNGKSEYIRTYRFKTLYNNSSSSSNSGSSYGGGNYSGSSYGGGSYSDDHRNPNYARFESKVETCKSISANVNNPNLEGLYGKTYNGEWMYAVKKVNGKYKISLNPEVFGSSWLDIKEYPNMIVLEKGEFDDRREELRKKRWNYYVDDCDENADPGYSKYGQYKYNNEYYISIRVVYLTNSGLSVAPVLFHCDYYLNDNGTYSETEILGETDTNYERY